MKRLFLAVCFMFVVVSGVSAKYEYRVYRQQMNYSNQEAMNSIGDYFQMREYETLASGASTWLLIDLSTATVNIYLDFEITATSGVATINLSSEPTVTSSGTLAGNSSSFNQTLLKTPALAAHVYANVPPATVAAGAVIEYVIMPQGTYSSPITHILRAGRVYLLSVINSAGIVQNIGIKLRWYER